MSTETEAYALFENFLRKLAEYSSRQCDVATVREALSAVNNFLYQKPEAGGTFMWGGDEFEFLSKYHIFWHNCCEDVIQPAVNDDACAVVADILHGLRGAQHGARLFTATVQTPALEPRALAQVRFFTAPQDFRGSTHLARAVSAYRDDPEAFSPKMVLEDVSSFLTSFMSQAQANEQRSAREKFAKTCAEILIRLDCDVYDLPAKFGGSAARLRRFLAEENVGTGFGYKKCDMFLRDMLVWKVWNLNDVECIDVASDSNTMRVALRSRILTTAIPLLSSFLDVFCYQYELIDKWNAGAWRRVWEKWRTLHGETCPAYPGLLDYFVYGVVGREFCRDAGLVVQQCDRDPSHVVYWHNARRKACRMCPGVPRGRLVTVGKYLPCTHEKGVMAIQQSRYVTGPNALLPGIRECPLVPVCRPRATDFRRRIAPDSISIYRETGWLSAYTTEEQGGGGLSS